MWSMFSANPDSSNHANASPSAEASFVEDGGFIYDVVAADNLSKASNIVKLC